MLAELVLARASDTPYVESADGSRSLTYLDLARAVSERASLLDGLGVAPGEIVEIPASDPVDFAAAFVGVLASGRVAAPVDPQAGPAALDRALVRSVSKQAGTGGLVLSTSGTTGAPKVIRLDESQLMHTARAVAGHHELGPGDRGFNPLPLFHVNAQVVGLLATLVAGATLVLDERFHRTGFWAQMARHRVTWINAVPAILARLVPLQAGETVPGGIRFARSASAPLSRAVLDRFERATGIPVLETYGMSESASQITANPLRGPRKPGSVGVPIGTEVRVRPCEGGPGRVEIRGPSVIGAYASPGYEHRFDPDGWLETGDLGTIDEDGYLFLAGRDDDVINRGGEKIYPREIEEALLSEPGVVAAVVVGRAHEALGEVPVAYVVAGMSDATDALVARLVERCAAALSRPKRPAAFHVVERLPAGPTGKVRRRDVLAMQ